MKQSRSPLPFHFYPVETETPYSEAECREQLLASIEQLLRTADFSRVRFLSESIPNARSAAQDRGHRLSHVLAGEKPIHYAKAGFLLEERCPENTCLFAKSGAWQTAGSETPFTVLGIALENNYTRYLLVENQASPLNRGRRYYFHTPSPPSPDLIDAANTVSQLLSSGCKDTLRIHWTIGTLWTVARQELAASIGQTAQPNSASNPSRRKWESIQRYLVDHFHEPISRESIGRLFGLTPAYVSQFYRQFSELSLSQALLKLRLDHATHLLIHGHETIAEVAYQSGFNDPSYFCRAFQKRFRQSPSAYRSSKRNS